MNVAKLTGLKVSMWKKFDFCVNVEVFKLAWSTFSKRYKTNKFEHVLTKAVEVNKQLKPATERGT